MANKVLIKRSSVAAKAPVSGDLDYGELAINYTDGKLYFKKADNSIDFFSTGGGGGGGTASLWVKKTTSYTAASGDKILSDTSGGSFAITLPVSPSIGDNVLIADAYDWSITSLTVNRNGSTIEGLAENLILNIKGIQVELIYDGSTWEIFTNAGPQELPSQSGNSGKYLTTDGTITSWETVSAVSLDTTQTITGTKTFTKEITQDLVGTTLSTARYAQTLKDSSGNIRHRLGLDTDNATTLWSHNSAGVVQGTHKWVGGNYTASGNISATSDKRLKTDLEKIENAIAKVKELTGYLYTRIDTGERQTGLLAQDVLKTMPEAVVDGEFLSIAYGNLIGLLVEAIKEQQTMIDEIRQVLGDGYGNTK